MLKTEDKVNAEIKNEDSNMPLEEEMDDLKSSENINAEKFKFQKLTPKDTMEDSKAYDEAMKFVFEENDLNNIAISGPYGSGKSTMINSYIKKNTDKNIIKVSLAHFNKDIKLIDEKVTNDDKSEEPNGNNKSKKKLTESLHSKEMVRDLEANVINQLIHLVDHTKIPLSRFKFIREINTKNGVINAILLTLLFVIGYHILFFDEWFNFVQQNIDGVESSILLITLSPTAKIVSLIMFIIILFRLIYKIVKCQYETNFIKRIALKDVSIALFSEEDSIFEKYTSEIIYLIRESGCEAIVFEDIDRFEQTMIFEHLRQINILINSKIEKPIKFFYLMKDDIFANKDRTKFFDFIIPIVPVIDSSNSHEQMVKIKNDIAANQNEINLSDNFLFDISLYLDDMRIINNVFNEFLVYNSRVNNTNLKSELLFAIIVYKNLFPHDFSELQLRRGFLYNVISNKAKIQEKRLKKIEDLEKAIAEIKLKLEKIYSQIKKDDEDIKENLIFKYHNSIQYFSYVTVNKESIFNSLLSSNPKVKNEFEEIQKISGSKREIYIQELEDEIVIINDKKITMKNAPIRYLIEIEDLNLNDYKSIRCSPYFESIFMMLKKGYIDETYSDYLTFFYKVVLSEKDKVFLRKLTLQNEDLRDIELENVQKVIDRIDVDLFHSKYILNYTLLTCLLNNIEESEDKLEAFLTQIKLNKDISFVNGFIELENENSDNVQKFVKRLNIVWKNIFVHLLETSDIVEKNRQEYILRTLLTATDDEIIELNINELLSNYINNNFKFIKNLNENDSSKILAKFNKLNVKLKNMDLEDVNDDLIKGILNKSIYQISLNNIKLALKNIYKIDNFSDIKSELYSKIMSTPDSVVAKYINTGENINLFVSCILNEYDGEILDTEEYATQILKMDSLSGENTTAYIKRYGNKFTNLNIVEPTDNWSYLLLYNKAEYNEINILSYFKLKKEIDDVLIDFINSEDKLLSFENSNEEKEIINLFYGKIIKNNKIGNKQYKNIMSNLTSSITEFADIDIDKGKVDILIEDGLLVMNLENLEFIRVNYEKNLELFIVKNISGYVEIINADNFEINELEFILDSKEVNDKEKLSLLELCEEYISIANRDFSDEIKIYILQNNFNVSEVNELLKNYVNYSSEVKKELNSLLSNDIFEVIENNLDDFSKELKMVMLNETSLIVSDLIGVLKSLIEIDNISLIEVQNILIKLGLKEVAHIFNKGVSLKISCGGDNEIALKMLKETNLIRSYYTKNDEWYTIRRANCYVDA